MKIENHTQKVKVILEKLSFCAAREARRASFFSWEAEADGEKQGDFAVENGPQKKENPTSGHMVNTKIYNRHLQLLVIENVIHCKW